MAEPIKILGRAPNTFVSDRDIAVAEQRYENEAPSFGEAFGAAVELETFMGVTDNNLKTFGFEPTPNYVPLQETIDSWTDGVRPEYHEEFLEATSDAHGSAIREKIMNEQKAEETLGHSAANGVGYRLLAAVTDPAAWAAMAATEGLAAPWVFAAKINRVQKAVRSAIVAGGGNAALETYLYSQSAVKDPQDILYAALLGGAIGAAVSPLVRAPASLAQVLERNVTKDAAYVANKTEETAIKGTEAEVPSTATEQPRVESTESLPPKAEDTESVAPKAEESDAWQAARAQAKAESDAWDELEAHEITLNRMIDDADVLKDARYNTAVTLEWVKDVVARLRVNAAKDTPKFRLDKDLPDDVAEVFETAEGALLKDELLEAIKNGEQDAYRLELRARLRKLDSDLKRQLKDIRNLDTRTATLNRRFADAKKANTGGVPDGSAGAAGVEGVGFDRALVNSEEARESMEEIAQDTSKLGKARIDIIGRLLKSPNAFVRNMASRLSVDSAGRFDHSVAGKTAEEIANHTREMSQMLFYKQFGIQFANWLSKKGLPWYARFQPSVRQAFNEEVADAMRGIGRPSDEAKAVGEVASDQMWELVNQANKAGVKGFEDISKFDPRTYFPRFIDKAAVRRLDAEFGTTNIEKLVALGIRKAIPGMDEEKIKVLARAYVDRLRKLEAGIEANFARTFSRENMDLVKEILDEGNVPADVSEGIMVSLKKANGKSEGGTIARAKRRLDLDEGVSLRLVAKDGIARDVSLKELFDNSAENVFNIYARQMSGQIGLAKMGFRSEAEFTKWLTYAKDEAVSIGGDASNSINKEVELLEFMYKAISGAPLERDPAGWLSQTARFIRDWNFLRIMNQVGFAQLAEIGNIVGQAGWRATLTHVPEIRAMLRRIKETGELEDDLASQLEAIIPIGTDRLRNQVSTRYDSSSYEGRPGAGFFAKAEHIQHHAKRVTADISLMAPVNMVLHRMSLKAGLQRLVDGAHGAGRELSEQRLAHLGISDDMKPRIYKLLREQTTLENSSLVKSKKIRSLNVDKMLKADPEATDVLIDAMSRWSRQMIQQNEIGATHELMHSTLGKILTQFRSFMLTAFGKQLLHGIRMNDMETYTSFAFSMAFGGMAYGLQNTINSIGRPDQDEFLRERLSPEAWGLAAFQRAGFASLIPAAIDSVWTNTLGTDPVFAYGRSTGLASDAFLGNPSIDLINKVSSAVGGSMKAAVRSDYDFSQKNFRDMWGLVWFSNAMVARNISEIMADGLPKRSTDDSLF